MYGEQRDVFKVYSYIRSLRDILLFVVVQYIRVYRYTGTLTISLCRLGYVSITLQNITCSHRKKMQYISQRVEYKKWSKEVF